MNFSNVVISTPSKKKLSSEEFRNKKDEVGILDLMFYYDLYDNWKDVIIYGDEIEMNLFFLIQNNIHPKIKERFLSCVNSSVKYLVGLSSNFGKKKGKQQI